MSDGEHLELLAGYEALCEKKWNCEACIRSTDQATRNAVKGCNGGKQFTIRAGGRDAFKIDRCIGNFYSPAVSFWYRAFKQFEKGVMPFDGPLMDQPAKALEVFSVFESLEFDRAEAARKNAERKKPRGR